MYKWILAKFANVGPGPGAGNMSFVRTTSIPPNYWNGSGYYTPKGSIHPQSPAYMKIGQDLPLVDLKANGMYFYGDIELQGLSNFQKGST